MATRKYIERFIFPSIEIDLSDHILFYNSHICFTIQGIIHKTNNQHYA